MDDSIRRQAADVPDTNVGDTIYRQAAIDAICDNCDAVKASCPHYPCARYVAVEKLPHAQSSDEYWRGYKDGQDALREEIWEYGRDRLD